MKSNSYFPLLLLLFFAISCGLGSNNNSINSAPANSTPANPAPANVQSTSGKTALEYMKEGNQLFYQKKYKESIEPLQKALDLEKAHPQLDKDSWFITVDNLTVAYGFNGDLDKSKAVIDYGISKEPDYPLFYYNMADIYGEKNDEDNAIAYLQKAFARKGNLIAGAKIPNPATDDSFRNLMKSEKFQKAIKELK